jgi:hypothetical protein
MKMPRAIEWIYERLSERRQAKRLASDPITHMFTEDVHTFIIPYRSKSGHPAEARCDGNADDVAIGLRTLRSIARSSSTETPTEVVSEAIRAVVQQMLWRGYAAFEIGERTDADDEDGYRRARRGDWAKRPHYPLQGIHNGRVIRLPFGIVEILDARRTRWDPELEAVQFYRSKRTWVVDVPRRLGGRWGLLLVLRRLRRFSGVFPEWTAASLAKEQSEVRFDVHRYSLLRTAYQATATGRWSWTGRDNSLTHQTEFFLFYRMLTFHHALAVLREHVVAEINRLLTRLKLDARVTFTGLPTPEEILAIRERMETGELSLGDAYEQATRH